MKKLFLAIISFYQRRISKLKTVRTCRFYPTCSQYSYEAIDKYGAFKGGLMAIKRILKCNPFHPGGYDPLN